MPQRLQTIWTPWRDHTELLSIRESFFPASTSGEQVGSKTKRKACDQVSAWKLRGSLPHAVESTWLLTEAGLLDEKPIDQTPDFAVQAAYITAISRFVTGLLDSQQESKYKISMYTQAQKVGLPALFVDLRHEASHGDTMPNLTNLRSAAERALQWLWDDYWKGLKRDAASTRGVDVMSARVEEHVSEKTDADEEQPPPPPQPGGWQRWQGRWTPKPIGTI